MQTFDGIMYAKMLHSGAAHLRAHTEEINALNVFPIPDGDTGDNMLLTLMGGVNASANETENLAECAKKIGDAMLFSARGNSGVILSQFFEGVKNGFSSLSSADSSALADAFLQGVEQAYRAVASPAEGTVLTVAREAAEYARAQKPTDIDGFFEAFLEEGYRSLARTPELLPVLKKAGVVDSGAAGFLYLVEGMRRAFGGENTESFSLPSSKSAEISFDAFDENSILTFGYCTEVLLRLQKAKTDLDAFNLDAVVSYLNEVGDSVVAVRNGTAVKIHVHTETPDKVLAFCRKYGEFLTVKIENMSLQHSNTMANEEKTERKKYGIVAVASGEGMKKAFLERGADVIVEGGQSMNPSAQDFVSAFEKVNAETVFVLPNNGNVILAAKQAAELYKNARVRVIESKSIGHGYAALSMWDPEMGDAGAIESVLTEGMEGVVTAEISRCVKDAEMDGLSMQEGDYIGFSGKKLLAVDSLRANAVLETLNALPFSDYDIGILIFGKGVPKEEAEGIRERLLKQDGQKEIYCMDGGQDIYDYIVIAE